MLPAIVVPANDIDTPGMSLDVELGADWVTAQVADADARADVPAHFKGRLSKSGKADIVVRGELSARVLVPCARCLRPVEVAVATELALLLKPVAKAKGPAPGHAPKSRADRASKPGGSRDKPEEYEFGSEEADLDEYDGERVVLDPFLREAILLELPSFPLCSESCPGIGPSEISPGAASAAGWQAGDHPLGASAGNGPSTDPFSGAGADRTGFGRKNPFEVLRGLMAGGTEGGVSDADASPARRPSPKEVRKVARKKSRNRPKIKSSIVGRGKK